DRYGRLLSRVPGRAAEVDPGFHSDLLRPALSDCDPIGLEARGEVAVVFLDVKVGRRAAASPPGRDAPALADPAQLADVKERDREAVAGGLGGGRPHPGRPARAVTDAGLA